MSEEPISFVCCFCGSAIRSEKNDPVEIAIATPDGGTQSLKAHAKCLRTHVHKSVPLALDDQDEKGFPNQQIHGTAYRRP